MSAGGNMSLYHVPFHSKNSLWTLGEIRLSETVTCFLLIADKPTLEFLQASEPAPGSAAGQAKKKAQILLDDLTGPGKNLGRSQRSHLNTDP